MRRSILCISAAAMFTFAASAAQAMPPVGDLSGASSAHIVLVRAGCGPGFFRDRFGRCRRNVVRPGPAWRRPAARCWRGPGGRLRCR